MKSNAQRLLVLTLAAVFTGFGFTAPALFTDPASYPAAWPDGLWWPYTMGGVPLFDESASRDGSTGGTTPTGSVDLVLDDAAHYYSDGSNVYLRFGIDGPPMSLSGSSQPFTSATWSVLMDTDGDGFREFAIMISGIDSSGHAQPDDIIVMYSDGRSQALNPDTQTIWRQDTARHPTDPSGAGMDGEPGTAANWDSDPDAYVWDFGRTRITQRDRTRNPGSNNSMYWLDLQLPMAALDATSRGGPAMTSRSIVRFVFTTANSNTNPAQKDFTFLSGYTFSDLTSPLPSGDATDLEGNTYAQPIVTRVQAAPTCSASVAIEADIAGVLEAWGGGLLRTDVRDAVFYVAPDPNANGLPDDGQAWTTIGTISMMATATNTSITGGTVQNDIGPWGLTWDPSGLPRGQYLIRVVATNAQALTTDSADADATSGTYNPGTYGTTPVLGTFVNTCGTPLVSLAKTVDQELVTAGADVQFTLTLTNPSASPVSLGSLTDRLPTGFTYTGTSGGTLTPSTLPAAGASGDVVWNFSPGASILAGTSETLVFTAQAPSVANTYSNTAEASTSVGTVVSNAVQIGVGAAELTLGATSDLSSAIPGQVVTYTLTYANDSPVNTQGASLTATLPTGLTYVTGGSLDATTRVVSWPIGDLPSGDGPYSVSLQAQVTDPYPNDAPALLVLPAELASNGTAPVQAEASTLVNVPRPDLRLDLSASSVVISPGGLVTLTNRYGNTGTATATTVTLSSAVPSGFTYSSSTGGGVLSGNTVTWSLGSLAAGAGGTASLTLQADSSYAAANPQTHTSTVDAAETAPVSSSTSVGVTSSECVPTTWYFTGTPYPLGTPYSTSVTDFTATMTAPTSSTSFDYVATVGSLYPAWEPILELYQDPPNTNEIVLTTSIDTTFYMSKDNTPLDLQAILYDLDPATGALTELGRSDADSNAAMSLSGTAITNRPVSFSVPLNGTLPKDHLLVWKFFGRTKQANSFTFHMDSTTSASRSYYCVTPPADLVLDARADTATASPGSTLVFTHAFGNAGQALATGSTLDAVLPAGVTFTSATLNGASVTPTQISGSTHSFTVNSSDTTVPGNLTAMQSGELIVTTTVDSPAPADLGMLTTMASLVSDQTVAITDAVDVRILQPDVGIAKNVDLTRLLPGETATYTIEVINSGSADATNVTVSEVLPETAYYTYVASSTTTEGVVASPDPVTSGNLHLDLGTIAAGSSITVTYRMRVASSGVPNGITTLESAATVRDDQTAGSRSSNSVAVSINSNPNLRISSGISPTGPVAPGATLTYTVTVQNIGASDALDLVIRHGIPNDSAYVGGTLAMNGVPVSDTADADAGRFDPVTPSTVFEATALASNASLTMTFQVRVNTPLPFGATDLTQTSAVTASNAAARSVGSSITANAAPDLSLVQSAPLELPLLITEIANTAASSTVITVLDASYVLPGDHVSLNGTIARVVSVTGNDITLDATVTAAAGDSLLPVYEYRLSYGNQGTADASSVLIDTVVPAGLEFLSATPAAGISPSVGSSGAVQWSIGSVPVGSSGSLTVRVRPSTSGTYTSSATIDSAETAAQNANDVIVSIGMLRALKRTSTASITVTPSGAQATYIITLENTLASAVSGVSITDVLPYGFTFSSTTSTTGGTCTGPSAGTSTPIWTSCSIPASSVLVIEFLVDLATSVPDGTYDNDLSVVSDSAGVMQFRSGFSTTEDVTVTNAAAGSDVSGVIYRDGNANSVRDDAEDWTGAPTVNVNLVQNGAVLETIPVAAGTGAFTFSTIPDGSYTVLVATDPATLVPHAPAGWLFLHPANGQHSITVAGANLAGLNIGLFQGSRVRGTIFQDHGHGAGTANDGLKNGSEPTASGVTLTATNGTLSLQTSTDATGAYSLLVPANWGSAVTLQHDAEIGTGFNDGVTPLYAAATLEDPAATSLTLDPTLGSDLQRNFGIVPRSSFAPDQTGQSISPGSATYTHLYQPGTLGTTSLGASGTHTYEFFLDTDCDGEITSSERTPTNSIVVDASWPRSSSGALRSCPIEVRVLVAAGQPSGRTDIATITHTLTWVGSSVTDARAVVDTTVVRDSVDLALSTRVRNITTGSVFGTLTQGEPGQALEYCTSYQNISTGPLTDVRVTIPVPFHTTFLPDAYGAGNDLKVTAGASTSYGTAAEDTDAVALSSSLVILDRGALLPADTGELCLRTVIR